MNPSLVPLYNKHLNLENTTWDVRISGDRTALIVRVSCAVDDLWATIDVAANETYDIRAAYEMRSRQRVTPRVSYNKSDTRNVFNIDPHSINIWKDAIDSYLQKLVQSHKDWINYIQLYLDECMYNHMPISDADDAMDKAYDKAAEDFVTTLVHHYKMRSSVVQ
jgi:hypothetical protein